MKFIRAFFTIFFLSQSSAYAIHISYEKTNTLVTDTIIQLDTLENGKPDLKKPLKSENITPIAKRDTIIPNGARDTIIGKGKIDTIQKTLSGLQSEVKYTAEDSIHADPVNNIIYLYGSARVIYDDFELDADYIRLDKNNNTIYASGIIDPKSKRFSGRPIYKQKDDKPLVADSMRFNYITKKGKIFQAFSEQEGNFISGGQAKILNNEEIAYHNVIFSTCNLPYPHTHFGIVITRGIAEKNQIVSGPAYLEIEGVPLPLAVPFGFFPKPNQRSSGIMLPSFSEDQRLGFALRNFGYYLGLSDYMDLTTTGSVFSKGSYELATNARYLKKYKFQGDLTLGYSSKKYGLETDPPAKDFNVRWSHSQDANARPGTTFSASVNAGTSSYFQNSPGQSQYNIQQLTNNNLSSSIAYGKTWEGTPFNLTVNLSHRQDISKKTMDLELPSMSFNMSTISPFDSKNRVGQQKWYQRLTVGYSLQASNKIDHIAESELFQKQTFTKKMQNGFNHQIPVGLSLNVLKYFQFSSSLNYNERWYFQTINKRFARGSVPGSDSLVVDTISGFKRASEYSVGTGLSTKFYGTYIFKGNLKAIRHVMTPSISFNYRPNFADPSFGYYRNAISNASVPYPYTNQRYSIFEQSIYGGPGGGRSAGIAFSVDNTIEAKLRARRSDTSQTDRKIPLLQGLSFSTFYNIVADSFKLSPINFSGRTSVFNQKLGVNFGGVLNPYISRVRDSVSNGRIVRYVRQIDRFTWQDGMLPKLTSFNFSLDFSFNSTAAKKRNEKLDQQNNMGNMNQDQSERLAMISRDPNAFVDFNIPWNIVLNYNFNYNNNGANTNISNTVNLNGDFNITPQWKFQYTTGYDFKQQKISTTSVSIYRDLHCWDLGVQWIPFGYYKFYSVDLRVKATILQDLKLSKRRDYYNTN
ncbi:MAG: putative LPS assembly protein LptD [Sphingobacteriaceae bacterium]